MNINDWKRSIHEALEGKKPPAWPEDTLTKKLIEEIYGDHALLKGFSLHQKRLMSLFIQHVSLNDRDDS